MKVTWKCPQCGTENENRTEKVGMNIFICDSEYGGCDKYSVVDVRSITTIETTVYKLKEAKNA